MQVVCVRKKSGEMDGKKKKRKKKSEQETSVEVESSLMSQSSLYSERSLQSETSMQSIQSYNSLASVPSLRTPLHTAGEGSWTARYRFIATVEAEAEEEAERGQGALALPLAAVGDLLYSGSSGSRIRVWKAKGEGDEVRTLEEYGFMGGQGRERGLWRWRWRWRGKSVGGVKCMVVAGERLYSAHTDHRISVWALREGKVVARLPTMKDYLIRFIVPGNRVRVRRKRKALWIEHVDTISAMAVDGKGFLYSASWDRTVKVWRPSDFRCVESFRAHDDAINAVVVSEEGFLYTASADAKVKVWTRPHAETPHSLVATLERHKSAINALALSTSSSPSPHSSLLLYSGACDRSIIVWEREESAQHMTVAGALRGHRRAVLCLATVGEVLCSGSADKTVRVWRRGPANSHSCLAVLDAHSGPVKSLALSASSSSSPSLSHAFLLYSSTLHNHIHLWSLSQPLIQFG